MAVFNLFIATLMVESLFYRGKFLDGGKSMVDDESMSELVDLLIVGGGINGVGIAADASGRGLSVLLCEQGDLAGATSYFAPSAPFTPALADSHGPLSLRPPGQTRSVAGFQRPAPAGR